MIVPFIIEGYCAADIRSEETSKYRNGAQFLDKLDWGSRMTSPSGLASQSCGFTIAEYSRALPGGVSCF